jgi:hypothetical protein
MPFGVLTVGVCVVFRVTPLSSRFQVFVFFLVCVFSSLAFFIRQFEDASGFPIGDGPILVLFSVFGVISAVCLGRLFPPAEWS